MRAQASIDRTDAVLRQDLFMAADRDRVDTADFLELIADFDARRLYLPEGYTSMHAFCVGALRMCEESAYKRIQAARAGRKHPQLFEALAEGRLHLSALFLLAPHVTSANVDELVESSTHRSKREIRDFLSRRFLGEAAAFRFEVEPSPAIASDGDDPGVRSVQLEPVPVERTPPDTTQRSVPQEVGPPDRIDVHLWVDREKLEYARALLSHANPSGDLDRIFDRALDAVIRETERRRFGAGVRPRALAPRRAPADARHIPAHVKREVWKRDGGRCTFVGRDGHRCGARRFLEFDHVRPVALGGEATVEGLRLRCRAHNQFEAERVFGEAFMEGKRAASRRDKAKAKEDPDDSRMRDVVAALRGLGCRADEARWAAEGAIAAAQAEAPLEECIRAALRSLRPPRSTRREATATVPVETREEALAVSGP